jgi:hypothetical protein
MLSFSFSETFYISLSFVHLVWVTCEEHSRWSLDCQAPSKCTRALYDLWTLEHYLTSWQINVSKVMFSWEFHKCVIFFQCSASFERTFHPFSDNQAFWHRSQLSRCVFLMRRQGRLPTVEGPSSNSNQSCYCRSVSGLLQLRPSMDRHYCTALKWTHRFWRMTGGSSGIPSVGHQNFVRIFVEGLQFSVFWKTQWGSSSRAINRGFLDCGPKPNGEFLHYQEFLLRWGFPRRE